ncbi:1,4-dihydroxy-6-naphthoate synthase [Shimazuella sp. AN120528]|uniref:1,4-dihydroxy-6-naphthoate synthase n=1 Tax=Shimazuella soli TaxID=1892854 RepID=UPI001F118009|nr:1,4-dihydroxy-6-naphthoate synthase [Shimazuella soli]MCH5585720.1 1,4-dihydroxy-6-naphthoate synthase [Shimazuella soli]
MDIAFSPCPNDTFIFHAWVNGLIPDAPKLKVTYADIDITNTLAEKADGPDILKISYASLPWVHESYGLLPCGGALGRGCGPLILTKQGQENVSLAGKSIAVPSERSTAFLLFRLWIAKHVPEGIKEIHVLPFHEIMPAIADGKMDAGLVIHEARFTYPSYGLRCVVDLGDWWEKDTSLPIPLGAIIAKKTLDLTKIAQWIRASLAHAQKHPRSSQKYVMDHAQELDWNVAQEHIDLYVNSFSHDLGKEGYQAIHALLTRAMKEGFIPTVDYKSLLIK